MRTALLALAFVTVLPFRGAAQTSSDMPLDELLNVPIHAAAKYEQRLADVSASVTIITREEIERFGYESLADVLQTVRGAYLSNDRNYTYLGIRGFSRPTDYNNRTLVLIDGHPMTDNIWGANPIGADLTIDLSAVDRIEFVRGPSSVLYGTGAMFGVINIVTTTDESDEPSTASIVAGSGQSTSASLHRSQIFPSGAIAEVTVLWRESQGEERLYFSEYDDPDSNNGIAENLDYERSEGAVGTFHHRDFRVTAYVGQRTKGIPTNPWAYGFNEPAESIDTRGFVDLSFERNISKNRTLAIRGAFDHCEYRGSYGGGYRDASDGQWGTLEARLLWDLRSNQRLTLGAEYSQSFKATYREAVSNGFDEKFDVASFYVQDEFQPHSRVTFTAGVRYDHYSDIEGTASPRLAVVFNPTSRRTIKVIAGDAHRVPNAYEVYLEDYDAGLKANLDLQPEKIRTFEAVWEERLTRTMFATASLYEFQATGLIEQQIDRDDYAWQYHNAGTANARGIELQLDFREKNLWAYWSWAYQYAESEKEWMTNSPRNLIKAGATLPIAGRGNAAAELQYDSGRRTIGENVTESYLGANLALSWRLTNQIQLRATVRNAFDTTYATPAGVEHAQDSIIQDGRTFQTKLTYTF